MGDWALQQLWLFWVAPIVGGLLGGWLHKAMLQDPGHEQSIVGRKD